MFHLCQHIVKIRQDAVSKLHFLPAKPNRWVIWESWNVGQIRKSSIRKMVPSFSIWKHRVAKNYLEEPEIDELNRIVAMWLDFAEDQARRRKQVFMKDWEQKLEEFLRFNERRVLSDAGKVSKTSADGYAKVEYEKFEVRRREYKETLAEKKIHRAIGRSGQTSPCQKEREEEECLA